MTQAERHGCVPLVLRAEPWVHDAQGPGTEHSLEEAWEDVWVGTEGGSRVKINLQRITSIASNYTEDAEPESQPPCNS